VAGQSGRLNIEDGGLFLGICSLLHDVMTGRSAGL
jgi:hypothetical protein